MILCFHHRMIWNWVTGCMVALGVLCAVPLAAQPTHFPFEHITQEHGLSQGYVNCILQDRQGFMWFGTGDGLNRYDGYDFVVYRHNPFDMHSISNNSIHTIYQDRSGLLWIGTERGGLNCYNPLTGRFTAYQHDPENDQSLSNNMVFGICEDPIDPGVLWVGTNWGLNRLTFKGPHRDQVEFRHFFHDPLDTTSLSSNYIRSIVADRAGNLWVGTWEGLNVLHRQSGAFQRIKLVNNQITKLYRCRSGKICVGSYNGGLSIFENLHSEAQHYGHTPQQSSLASNMVLSLLEDSAGRMWVGTSNGLDLFDAQTGTFIHHRHAPSDPFSLSHNEILSLWQSPSGVLWAGTNTGGVNRFKPDPIGFHHIAAGEDEHSLAHCSVYAIYESPSDPGKIWIGTGGGTLHCFDRSSGAIKRFPLYPERHTLLYSIYIYAIIQDPLGHLWLGSTDGFKGFDRRTGQFTHYVHDPENPGSMSAVKRINCFCLDPKSEHLFWAGYDFSGLSRFDTETDQFDYFTPDQTDATTITPKTITCIIQSRRGGLWVGTKNGLKYYDESKQVFTHYVNTPENRNSLSSNYIKCLLEMPTGELWVGTFGGGLNKIEGFDRGALRFTHYTEDHGLSNDVVYGILNDDKGRLWLSTNLGLSCFHPDTETFRNFDSRDGLQSNEFNSGAYFKSANGELYFGGINGFNWFHPDSIRDNRHRPEVVFTEFQLFNEPVAPDASGLLKQPIAATGEIVLHHHQDVFSLQFAALDFAEPAKNRYAYKLEGYEKHWNEIGSRRFVTFTNLPAGEYTLRVRASNNTGLWNMEGASLRLQIKPPWFKTVWAYVLFALALVGLCMLGMRFHINRAHMKSQIELKRLEAEKLQELDHIKSGFFANISHEFRTPLTLILGAAEQLNADDFKGNLKQQSQRLTANARQLLVLVNEILDLAKLEAGRLRLQRAPGDFILQIRGLLHSFDTLAKARHIELVFLSNCDVLVLNYDCMQLEKVIRNLLSNAMKATPDRGEIRVSVTVNRQVEFSVQDSGAGIGEKHIPYVFDRFYQADDGQGQDQRGTGIGLALTRELVRLHGGSVFVESTLGQGAKFTVRLPLEHVLRYQLNGDSPVLKKSPPCTGEAKAAEPRRTGEVQDLQDVPMLLVVEDNADMRAYILEILTQGYQLFEASDGKQGLDRAVALIPDLIISDVMMPRMNGYKLCEILKRDERTSHIPVILLTAKSSDESKIQGLSLGADDYLSKPFNSTELRVRVKNLIGQRQKLRERFTRQMVLQQHDLHVPAPGEAFVARSIALIESHMEDTDLSVDWLGREMGYSRAQFYRKVTSVTGQTPSQFISVIRLKFAAGLLKRGECTVSEIAYRAGFSSPSYFHKCFKELYGMTPTEYASK